ncbi:MAG: antibiotic biosynthesis monooxygenase [Microcoleaceae cyanobacterium MO_207.B10]|nr:antibiotic biosynthesis monooxygenase [Microcoleaceae cyanobacterium MO_207.B10]
MSQETVRVVARVVAFPNTVEQVKSILVDIVLPTRQEKGCIKYELLQNQTDPTDFTFVEEWESESLLEKHLASDHIQASSSQLNKLVSIPPDIRRYRLIT